METKPLQVVVVSADQVVWEGEADQIVARTSEGDIGILPNHSPVLAVLVPCGVEVFSTEGSREVVAVDGGFISVDHGRVSILSEYARMANEISLDEAERELADAEKRLDDGDQDDETRKRFLRASAQVRAARKHAGNSHM